jgi:hypothetical protein
MKATEAGPGKLIDDSEFYQRSSAGAGFALGVADNMMLKRMSELMSDYVLRNYDAAVGGKTGVTDELLRDHDAEVGDKTAATNELDNAQAEAAN